MIPLDRFLAAEPNAASQSVESAFASLAALTALRQTPSGEFYVSNYKRAHLLYALIRRHRPRTVLEIGTGRGYGALAMAMAATDAGLPTRIFTVDVLAPSHPQHWALDEGNGPKVVERCLRDVWKRFPATWTERIVLLTGTSIAAMRAIVADHTSPSVDFAFVDGSHDYWTVRHDVLASVLAARGHAITLLLDDYGGVQGQGVKRLVDHTLAPRVAAGTLSLLEMPQSAVEYQDNGPHGMAYFDGRVMTLTADLLAPNALAGYRAHRLAARLEGVAFRARYRMARTVRGGPA